MKTYVFPDEHNCDHTYVLAADAQAQIEALQAQIDKTNLENAYVNNETQNILCGGILDRDIKISALRQQVEALTKERDAWKRALHSLTPGGSEYANDSKTCVNWVREARSRQHETIIESVKQRKELQAALDAEREKLVAVAKERDVQCTLKQNCIGMLEQEREKVKGLHEITKVICTHCCEPMEIASKAVLQTQLTQLQALVRAISETMEPFRKSLAKLDEVDTLATRRIAEADAYYCAQRVLATLDATTPAPKGGDGE